jgi:hypothetical protein
MRGPELIDPVTGKRTIGKGTYRESKITQESIDDFRFQKAEPELYSRLMQDIASGNASPESYENPIAKRMVEKNQTMRARQAEFQRNYVPPPPKPAPDGTAGNPFEMRRL